MSLTEGERNLLTFDIRLCGDFKESCTCFVLVSALKYKVKSKSSIDRVL